MPRRTLRLAWLACSALTVGLTGCVSGSTASSGKTGGTGGGSGSMGTGGENAGDASASDGGGTGGRTGSGGNVGATGGAPSGSDGGVPSGTATCLDLVQCIGGCDASSCQDACAANASQAAVDAAVALGTCTQAHACGDATCIQASCAKELAACTQITADGGSGPQPEVPVVGTREAWAGFSYVVPPGMTEQTFADGVVLTNTTKCSISFLPQAAASGEPGAQALSILLGFVGAKYPSLYDENGGTSPLTMKRRGQTGDGFPWMMVRGYLSDAQGAQASWAQVMLVELGSKVAPVIGVGDRSCFDDPVAGKKLDWTWMFLSLRFPGVAAPAGPRLADELVGKWLVNSGSILLGEIYAANGHYGTVSSLQTYSQVSSTDVLQTTTTFFGDGTFEAVEDRLTTRPASGTEKTRLFTIIEEQNSAVPTGWLPVLHRIELGTDGQPYEFTIARDLQ
jgi:hypothetical protein